MSAAQNLTRALRGSWQGHYGIARCPAHDDHSPSLSIADGTTGHVLLKCHAGCSYEAISNALPTGQSVGARWEVSDADKKAARRAADECAKRKTAQALTLWRSSVPIEGTPAEHYLRARGIICSLPPTLRYISNCWHLTAKRFPALISYITGAKGSAIHRTYINTGVQGKANVTPAKVMLGQTKGGAVRLSDGPDKLVVAEGIETALSLMTGLYPGKHRVWAAVSASGMAALELPTKPSQLVVASDGDSTGREAAEKLCNRAHALGWKVSLLPAPDGQDWNDVLQGREVTQ
jgi:hypothetical protein